MNRLAVVTSLAPLLFAGGLAFADVRDSAAERQLSLSENAPALAFPRSDWVIGSERVRPDRQVIYYLLSSEKTQVTFSVYINGTGACLAAADCLGMAMKNPSYKDARDLVFADAGSFKVAHFFLDRPMGAPIQQTHVVAAGVVNGHWFDIHLSIAGKERPDPAQLLELLKAFSLR